MRRLLTILLFSMLFLTTNAFACDYCLLSQGISPLETMKGGGVRINERYLVLDEVYHGAGKVANPGAKETFLTTEVTGFYSLTEDLMALLTVPVRKTRQTGEIKVNPNGSLSLDTTGKGGQSGLGDIAAMGRYTFYRNHTLDTTTTAAWVFGIKLPTGSTTGKTDDGSHFLDSHLQLGTGSTDFLAGLSMNHSISQLSISGNLLGTITTRGKDGNAKHQFGNTINYDLTAKYRVYPVEFMPERPQIFLALGVNGELTQREMQDGVRIDDSGGNTTYLSPGVQVVLTPHWVFELLYQKAIYHNLYGIQTGADYRASGGVTYLF